MFQSTNQNYNIYIVVIFDSFASYGKSMYLSKDMQDSPRANRLGLQRTCLNEFQEIVDPTA